MKTCRLALAALICLAPFARGQDPEIPRVIPKPNPQEAKTGSGDSDPATEEGIDDVKAGELSAGKAEPVEPVIRSDLAFHMAPVLSFQPRRIAPGAVGEAHLVLSMQRDTVLQVGGLKLEYPREQGPVRLGDWTIDEPALGLEPGPFRGQPVYENYAQVVIPISVAAGADHKSYPVILQVIAEVTDGKTGANRGESQAPARAELDVGPPLATPTVAQATRTSPRAGPAVQTPVEDDDPVGDMTDDAGESPSAPAIEGERAAAVPATGDSPVAQDAPPAGPLPVDEGSGSILWIGGGAGLLLLLVTALALRRR